MSFFDFFDVSGIIPHGFCLKWTPGILWSYVISDSLITLIILVPVLLTYIVFQRKDLKCPWIYLMFSAFIVPSACGTTHLMSIVLIWHPLYSLDAFIKDLTAAISITTAILLVRLVPQALKLPSLQQLETEIRAKNQAQCELQESETKQRVLSQQLTCLIEAIPDAIVFKDGDGHMLIANQYAKRLLRLDGLEWEGKTYKQFVHAQSEMQEKESKFLSDDEAIWNAGHLFICEDRILNDEGRLIEIGVTESTNFYARSTT